MIVRRASPAGDSWGVATPANTQPTASSPTWSMTFVLEQMPVVTTGIVIPSAARPRIMPRQPASEYTEIKRSGSSAAASRIKPWKPASVQRP